MKIYSLAFFLFISPFSQASTILVTGAAGFIGYHTSLALLNGGENVIGIDNMNSYYNVSLKESRLVSLIQFTSFAFEKCDISDMEGLHEIFKKYRPKKVIHLAAQAGVRYSLDAPLTYVQSNLLGFATILECCHQEEGFEHLVYASTSSVYGQSQDQPFKEDTVTDSPISFYAATKKSNEIMAQSYYHTFNFPITGLRLFTVYGPYGRPDMAIFKFTKNILAGKPLEIYGDGSAKRDWTYIDDTVSGIMAALKTPPEKKTLSQHPIYNISQGKQESLLNAIKVIEENTNKKATLEFLASQLGDVQSTYGDISKAQRELGYEPKISLEEGIKRFESWYKKYYDKD